MERVDVVVVGGGPGGTAAAHAAATEGADVVLFEKGVPRADREELGPDSTDAAGILDYWVDIMELDPREFPEGIILQELEAAEFIGPSESVRLTKTGIPASYPHFGFAYDRRKFDDWLLDRAATAGVVNQIGQTVTGVSTAVGDTPMHTVQVSNGDEYLAENVILADGPQRTVTLGVLDQFLPDNRAESALSPRSANHIAYQEYREFPPEIFEESTIKFWWGHIPGHTAYPWVFPNRDNVARVGLTMPIGVDLETVDNLQAYKLLRADDETMPTGREIINRLLTMVYGDRYDLDEFPVVEGLGKRKGTETYPISSTKPIDSPTNYNIAVVGGAMGVTSAFHEGGGHVAIRTGKIAGKLAALGDLDRYNQVWKEAIGDEVVRNVAMAELVREYGPEEWDTAFRVASQLNPVGGNRTSVLNGLLGAGFAGLRLVCEYHYYKYQCRNNRYVQLSEAEYPNPSGG